MRISLEKDYERSVSESKRAVVEGKLIIYPTDTVYGIGGNALDEKVVAKVYAAKGRNERKPLSMILGKFEMIEEYCYINNEERAILLKYLPGPYTFIMRLKKKIPVSENDRVGIRVPNYMFIRRVSSELGLPIITTSANRSGEKEPCSLEELDDAIARKAAVIVDGGRCAFCQVSTVVDLVDRKILRKGAGEFSFR